MLLANARIEEPRDGCEGCKLCLDHAQGTATSLLFIVKS